VFAQRAGDNMNESYKLIGIHYIYSVILTWDVVIHIICA